MVKNRIISTLLAVIMLLGAFTLMASAEETEAFVPEYNTKSNTPTINYLQGRVDPKDTGATATGAEIQTPEQKLDTMDLRLEKDGYRLYVDAYSGEIACECIASGEILFTNPYDVGSSTATDDIKSQLLSQIKINFTDIVSGDTEEYWSYEWAASRGQIIVKNIKGGLRVEYTIGREEAKLLVPECIEKSSFEAKILNVVKDALTNDEDGYTAADDFTYKKLTSYYSLKDTSTMTSQASITETQKAFPITKKMAVYVLDSATTSNEKAKVEQIIKTYCPSYSYENLDEDHLKTEWESEDENPPLFKLALEYTLDEMGLVVRLPANGIRFSESLFRLDSIEILPYMGAGSNPNSGYTFFPDGSGTLFDFEATAALGTSTTVTGKVYGVDYAYHDITGTHQETIRYPVFGVYEDQGVTVTEKEVIENEDGTTTTNTSSTTTYKERGFVAIVEEGDAMMELTAYHAVRTNEYNTVKMAVYPRPQDTYNVADAISVGQNDTWTVVSARKYTGNYKVRYIMLTSDEVAEEKQLTGTYDTSYVGMAKAYRDYLVKNGVLTKLTADDIKSDIPLYIETFGAMETTERFLSIPFDVMTPLTTFADINTMYGELSAKGITNINFIMTGYTDGGLTNPKAPYNLKWENAVEDGGMDFEDLTAVAKEKGFQLFPDFDFVFTSTNTLFDGVNLKKHAIKTIDDRYTSKREYSATKQTYVSYYELALSPAYFSHFYEKFTENYLEYSPIGISVSTLGSYLNSDFDEDEPYNRADAKNFTEQAFQYLSENYNKVMTAGGNAFTWKYVDYITDIALDSSRFSQSSAAVPFLGIVLHGYVEYAGSAINMEGNIEYAMLKAIENGAALKFILSYQNTDNLKDYITLSQYYSVRYDIWFEDMVALYSELNDVLKDLQLSTIETHKFLEGTRIPDSDELEADLEEAIANAIAEEEALSLAQKEALRKQLREARKLIKERINDVNGAFVADSTDKLVTVADMMVELDTYKLNLNKALKLSTLEAALEEYRAEKKAYDDAAEAKTTAETEKTDAETARDTAKEALDAATDADRADKQAAYDAALEDVETKTEAYETAVAALATAKSDLDEKAAELVDTIKSVSGNDVTYETYDELYEKATNEVNGIKGLGDAKNILSLIYAKADEAIKATRALISDYDSAVEGLALLDKEGAYTQKIRDELKAIVEANKASYDTLAGTAEGTVSYEDRIKAIATEAYNEYAFKNTEDTETKTYEFVEATKDEGGNSDTGASASDGYSKYTSDTNKIVYMEYVNADNGSVTAFILNFNNYAVTVTADNGISYTLEAYGYIVLKPQNS